MKKHHRPCSACQYHKKRCSSQCPLAPIFTPDRSEDFKAVSRVFGAGNFIQLMKSTEPHQQVLAAESLITEAKARIADPVRGLVGTMHNLSGKLDDLHYEIVMIRQQNELNLRRNTLQYKHIVAVPSTLLQQLGSFGDFLIPAVPSDRKSCAACKHSKEKCPPQCLLAPHFPLHRKEDFENVVNVFGVANFKKLMNSANAQQHLAAESMIIEATARISDPVHGLASIAETLSQQLVDLTSDLASVNQQNKHDLSRIIVLQRKSFEEPQNRSTSAERALSPAQVVAPSLPLQDLSSFNNSLSPAALSTQNDGLLSYFPTVPVESVYTNQLRDIQAKLKAYMDSKELEVNSNLYSTGAIFKCSNGNNADDIKPTAASLSVYTNQPRDIQAKPKYHMDAEESTVNSNLCSGAIFKCSNNDGDLTKRPFQENKEIAGTCSPRVKKQPRFI